MVATFKTFLYKPELSIRWQILFLQPPNLRKTSYHIFFSDAKDMQQLRDNKITHILAVHDNAAPVLDVS